MTLNYQQVTRHFGHLFPIHIEALCELLIVLRQQFQGDLDLMLILAIISSRAMPARQGQTTDMSYSQFISDQSKERRRPTHQYPVNCRMQRHSTRNRAPQSQ